MMDETIASQYDPLHNVAQMAALIAEVTGISPEQALGRLREEFERPGGTVARDFAQRGLVPYAWGQGLIDFYGQSDAFLYELAVWNCNAIKVNLRRWITTYLWGLGRGPLKVLSIGDGLGLDTLKLARDGHHVTYFELPGYCVEVARRLFARTETPIHIVTDPAQLPSQAFDVVLCLDVLEHVPSPSDHVRDMAGWLRPGGLLLVHAPFYLIHPDYPTHLESNRRYSGSLRLYEKHGLELADGRAMWNPLVLRKSGGTPLTAGSLIRRGLIRLFNLYLKTGRWSRIPQTGLVGARKRNARWFA